jgi:hypothetical protein
MLRGGDVLGESAVGGASAGERDSDDSLSGAGGAAVSAASLPPSVKSISGGAMFSMSREVIPAGGGVSRLLSAV